jgi:effector-binding domain-containing protein
MSGARHLKRAALRHLAMGYYKMIDAPQIVQLAARQVAVIRMLVPREQIQNEMGPAVQELYAAIAAQGIPPAGPWFTHHFRRPGDTFDFEAGVPVASQVTAVGRIQATVWPAMKVARTVYSGGYEGLGAAWGEFIKWTEAQKLKTSPELWEVYTTGPESGADAAQWRTELNLPLTD